MSSNYKKASKGSRMSYEKRTYLTHSEKLDLLQNTEEWQDAGTCQRLAPLSERERHWRIKTKGNSKREFSSPVVELPDFLASQLQSKIQTKVVDPQQKLKGANNDSTY